MDRVLARAGTEGAAVRPAAGDGAPLERELKFICSPEALARSRELPCLGGGRDRRMRLVTTYFDTPGGALREHGYTLRVRRYRNRFTQTVKREAGPSDGVFSRSEAEVRTQSADPDPALFGEPLAGRLSRIVSGETLEPVFVTDVLRLARIVERDGATVEVAFDEGRITAGDVASPLCELELELLRGDPAALYALAGKILDDVPLRLSIAAKSDRGFALVGGERPRAVHAVAPALARTQTLDEAVAVILHAPLAQAIGNMDALQEGQPEAVHQMRVALRRLRSALGVFGRGLGCEAFTPFAEEAKRIAAVLGEARDWRVLSDLVERGPRHHAPAEHGFAGLEAAMAERLDTGLAAARALVDDPRLARFFVALEAFVQARGWRPHVAEERRHVLQEPAVAFADKALRTLLERTLKRGKGFASLAPEARHKVRISLKQLRYGVEFFGPLYKGGEVRRYADRLSAMQDALGAFNDMAVAADRIATLPQPDPDVARAAGFVLGWLARDAPAHDGELVAAWKRFRKAEPFWK